MYSNWILVSLSFPYFVISYLSLVSMVSRIYFNPPWIASTLFWCRVLKRLGMWSYPFSSFVDDFVVVLINLMFICLTNFVGYWLFVFPLSVWTLGFNFVMLDWFLSLIALFILVSMCDCLMYWLLSKRFRDHENNEKSCSISDSISNMYRDGFYSF